MRIYLSSTFEDLTEHRAAALQVLRQLGHDVVAMEDYVAESSVPLNKVLEDVASCDLFVGIVGWRYGYVPKKGPDIDFERATAGKTSITEYEYRKAAAEGKTVLAFLLDERAPWPAHFIDGLRDPKKGASLREFRDELQRERLVSYFTTPDSLASRVAAAVSTAGMREEVKRQLVAPFSAATVGAFSSPTYLDDSLVMPIVDLVSQSAPSMAVAIDLSTTWWSTRLYLLAAIGEQLGDLRRILVLEDEKFVGMVSASSVRSALRRIHREADLFEKRVLSRGPDADVEQTATSYLEQWNRAILKAEPNDSAAEGKIAQSVSIPNLRLWLGESFLETPVRIDDLNMASVVDLLRILDYPNDFVPVLAVRTPSPESVQLVNKRDLSDRLARGAVVEMLDRLGVR